MRSLRLVIIMIIPFLLFAQRGVDITGRASLQVVNVDYDTSSAIKPDSIPADAYAKTTLVPGLQQKLNLALFARTQNMDITLLGDIRNDTWNKLENLDNINRLTLNARIGSHEFIVGDFFESGSELYMLSREIRGAKAHVNFENLGNSNAFIESEVAGGQVQREYAVGSRLPDLYHQYETAGQFRRYFVNGMLRAGNRNLFNIGLKYLYATDDENSIDDSFNEPLSNQNYGATASLYLWKKNIHLFGEGYFSRKDTVTASGINDHAYKGGVDFRYNRFKLMAYYYRLGYDYYTAGYPYLENDRQGFNVTTAYYLPDFFTFNLAGEKYDDNLDDLSSLPTTTTRFAEVSLTTHFKKMPELTLKWRLRDDNSNTVNFDDGTVKRTDKISRTYEGRISHNFNANRLSLSAIYIDLEDNSKLRGALPLGTEQFIGSFNFYARPSNYFYISGGSIYSRLLMSDARENKNIYVYESSRWDIIPRTVKLETTISYTYNDASNGGFEDLLSDYSQIGANLSLEYFFTSNFSLKVIGGTDIRQMRYSRQKALQVIADPDGGPTFFNWNESYDGLKYGMEVNWIF